MSVRAFLLWLTLAMVALSSAMVGAHDTMQVLVTNQTPCHVKVAIDGRNGTIEPWKIVRSCKIAAPPMSAGVMLTC